jgi:hypothetical protein
MRGRRDAPDALWGLRYAQIRAYTVVQRINAYVKGVAQRGLHKFTSTERVSGVHMKVRTALKGGTTPDS